MTDPLSEEMRFRRMAARFIAQFGHWTDTDRARWAADWVRPATEEEMMPTDPMAEGREYFLSTDRHFTANWQLRPYEAVPLPIAVELAELVTEACRWFCEPDHRFHGDAGAPALTDEDVAAVLDALQKQLDKEGESRTRGATCSRHGVKHTHWYRLAELPPARGRALVERVWALRAASGVTVTVHRLTDPPPPTPAADAQAAYDYYGYGWLVP